jgi:ABC-2 type transport system permease protein
MAAPAFLIAEREFRTYVATLSFWIALAIGPLLMAGMLIVGTGSGAPATITISAGSKESPGDGQLVQSAARALADSGRIERKHFQMLTTNARYSLVLEHHGAERIALHFSNGFPLSVAGRALVARTLERDAALARLAASGYASPPLEVRADGKPSGPDEHALSRFALVMILWLTLTGSLGMLLQAVVRERANRALEGLLAAARPWEIMAGKLAGVGAVSALILCAWLGGATALSAFEPSGTGLVARVFAGFANPAVLLRAALVYLLAYAFYGSLTVGIGAAARDVAAAQNLSRPMFAVLLAVFFSALTGVSDSGLSWLLYVPPFTPFVLLLRAPADLSSVSQALAIGLLVIATAGITWLAIGRLTLSGTRLKPSA